MKKFYKALHVAGRYLVATAIFLFVISVLGSDRYNLLNELLRAIALLILILAVAYSFHNQEFPKG